MCFQPMRYGQRLLIIDPGHGGEDGGAVSVTGTAESAINLAIALKMDAFCGLFGVEHILTRSSDVSLKDHDASTLAEMKRTDLYNRVALVEETSGAVLVSIHQNYFASGSICSMTAMAGFSFAILRRRAMSSRASHSFSSCASVFSCSRARRISVSV